MIHTIAEDGKDFYYYCILLFMKIDGNEINKAMDDNIKSYPIFFIFSFIITFFISLLLIPLYLYIIFLNFDGFTLFIFVAIMLSVLLISLIMVLSVIIIRLTKKFRVC